MVLGMSWLAVACASSGEQASTHRSEATVQPLGDIEDDDTSTPASSAILSELDQAIADGHIARCDEGYYSGNTDFADTCSGGGGVDFWLAPYGECGDGTVIAINHDADCGAH